MPLLDALARPLRNLRVSVTDRCNLRCAYCMPEEEYAWLPREDLLTFEEIQRVVGVFLGLGAERVRLTGGEPLLRRDVDRLIALLAADPRLHDLSLTTNGVLLDGQAESLRRAGLHRVTVSLDTLRPERHEQLTRQANHGRVIAGIRAASRAGYSRVKINTVALRGLNDDELPDLLEFARGQGAEIRFIEYMDVGGATRWSLAQVISRTEILEALAARFGTITPLPAVDRAPAQRYRLGDGTTFGIIASTTSPFCRACDRSRLTADGVWFLCLYAPRGIDLRGPLRSGASDEDLASLLRAAWSARVDRGAEERLQAARAPLPVEVLRTDPHLEMHTRGG
jgi:cyclic pyranopterin phosphate synthase